MTPPLSRRAIALLSAAALALVVLAPAQLALRKVVGEPYPRLMMPSFGTVAADPETVEFRTLAIIGVRADGTTRSLDIPRLLPRSETLPMILATEAFGQKRIRESPATATWLAASIAHAYADEHFTAADIVWTDRSIALATGTRTSTVDTRSSHRIELDRGAAQ